MNGEIAAALVEAAQSKDRVSGLTHNFYRYPARFSPQFARAAISSLSKPGDMVLDPYMGGGTTVVEAMAAGRRAYGGDLNQLAVFVAHSKTTFLSDTEVDEVSGWLERAYCSMSFRAPRWRVRHLVEDAKTKNMNLSQARPVKKAIACALLETDAIHSMHAKRFARCVLLRTGQWAIDGRKSVPHLKELRLKLRLFATDMLRGLNELRDRCSVYGEREVRPVLIECGAADLHTKRPFRFGNVKADLVVTSPPYPGVHVLYHRWQINGRRETPAPYWIANCCDGRGSAYYNFADRRGGGLEKYFRVSAETLRTIRRLIRDGGKIVQLLAFSQPSSQLPQYLDNMRKAGFEEVLLTGNCRERIWRNVPGRRWHATLKGRTGSAREVVLVHRAV